MHLRCPHCQNPIELADLPSGGEVTCAGCGSSFQLDKFSTATWDAPAKKFIGKFEVLATVGHGAFGTVLKAHDTELDRFVAIKVPRASNVGPGPEDVDRFLREARAVAQLRFPSIVAIHEVGTDNGLPYLVSDFVEGITLADHLTGRGCSFTESAKLLAEVADALQYAHSLGVVHRDVKPSNIMIRPDGSPCVMDFGLAKRDAGEITMTIDGQILGTPAYMSPEQARGESHKVDGKSDVYSLGVILYQLLTGELPFRGNKAMLLHQVLHEEPRSARSLNDKIPRDLETIALKAMAKEPGRRYASASGVADDLRRWLAGEPILARPVGSLERSWRWCKRKPALAAANAAVVLAMITFAGAFVVVNGSLQNETMQRKKAEKLAQDNDLLARQQAELAAANKKLATEAEQRLEEVEELTLQKSFNDFHAQSRHNTGLALVGTAQLLPKAAKLKNKRLLESVRLHLGAWSAEVNQNPLRSIFAHGDLVIQAAVSADGRIVLTGSHDNTARLWNAATGKPIGPPLHHDHHVTAVALSADSAVALTGSLDKTARLWECATGKPIGPPLQHQNAVYAVALSTDGKMALTGSQDKTARLWDTATSKPIGPPLQHQGSVFGVALSADGKVALTRSDDTTARLWDTATSKPIGPPLEHQGSVVAVALSADGKTAVTGSGDSRARLWETATGKPIGPPLQHQGTVFAVALSADGKIAVTGSEDKTARLWVAATGKPIGPPLQHQDRVRAVALSADGKIALTGSDDKTARLWETALGRPIGRLLQHQGMVIAVALSAKGDIAVTASVDKTARLWKMIAPRPIGLPFQHQGEVWAVALSADGKLALTGSKDNTARLWETKTGKPIGPTLEHPDWVSSVALSADGKIALTGCWDNAARLWETATGKPIGRSLLHQDKVRAVALSSDGAIAMTGSYDGTARLWTTATAKSIGPALQHDGQVFGVGVSNDGSIAITGYGSRGQLWNALTSTPIGSRLEHAGAIQGVGLSGDGKIAMTGSQDNMARLWDTRTAMQVGPPLLHDRIRHVSLRADGKIGMTGGHKTAQLWETISGKAIGAPLLHQADVRAVALSADGRFALTGAGNTAQIWSVAPYVLDSQQILLWAQVITGIEADEHGNARVLDAATWQQRRQRLQELGGPPVE